MTASRQDIAELLQALTQGKLTVRQALDQLTDLPFEQLSHSCIDHHRQLRTGMPEAVWCQNKTPRQTAEILQAIAQRQQPILATRAEEDHYQLARVNIPTLQYDPSAKVIYRLPKTPNHTGPILVICAGTSDLPVAREAWLSLKVMGHPAQLVADVGVAGIHRLQPHLAALRQAKAVIAVAGMEGALVSVVAGLTSAPVIGVPTSVGYGVGRGGFVALGAMLTACAQGVTVVNIDNGFGAACAAVRIARNAESTSTP